MDAALLAKPPKKMSKSELKKWKKKQRAAAAKARKLKEAADFEAQLAAAGDDGEGETVAKAEDGAAEENNGGDGGEADGDKDNGGDVGELTVSNSSVTEENKTPVDQLVTDSGEVAAGSVANNEKVATDQVPRPRFCLSLFIRAVFCRMLEQMKKMRLL